MKTLLAVLLLSMVCLSAGAISLPSFLVQLGYSGAYSCSGALPPGMSCDSSGRHHIAIDVLTDCRTYAKSFPSEFPNEIVVFQAKNCKYQGRFPPAQNLVELVLTASDMLIDMGNLTVSNYPKLQRLDLTNSTGVTGELPSIALLPPGLKSLSASSTNLRWKVTTVLGQWCWAILELRSTRPSGTWDPTLKLPCMEIMDVRDNDISGRISDRAFSGVLRTFYASGNPSLRGGNLTSLLEGSNRLYGLRMNGIQFDTPDVKLDNHTNLVEFLLPQSNIRSFDLKIARPIHIDLSQNQLSELRISGTGLVNLNVSRNPLSSLPPGLTYNVLDIAKTSISSLPPQSELQELTYLDASTNSLGSLPMLTKAKYIYASDNQIGSWPAGPWPDLIELDLSNNQLRDAPTELPPAMKTLRLVNNSLSGRFPLPGASHPLTTLDISYNRYTRLDGTLPTGCKVIRLTGNGFKKIPSLDALTSLTELSASDCKISDLPSVPASLDILNLANNQLKGNLGMLSVATNLSVLNLRHNSLSGNLNVLKSLPNLVEVNLAFNEFVGTIPSLSSVRSLQLDNNQLEGEPNLPLGATLVSLSNNHLSGTIPRPANQDSFTSLETLNLAGNQLGGAFSNWLLADSQFPTALKYLNLSGNVITGTLTPSLTFTGLGVLDVSRNHMGGNLPSWIGYVFEVNIANNKLAHGIPLLRVTRHFNAAGNRLDPCYRIPEGISMQSCDLTSQTVCVASASCSSGLAAIGCTTSFGSQTCEPCKAELPGDGFFCEFGNWVSLGYNTSGTVISGGGVTKIEGNFTVSNGSLQVTSGSTVDITGCSEFSGSLTVAVPLTQLEKWSKDPKGGSAVLLRSSAGWCNGHIPLYNLKLKLPKSCMKVKHRSETGPTSITVYFIVDKSTCEKSFWPIALGTLFGVILLILVVVGFMRCNRTTRKWFRVGRTDGELELELEEAEETGVYRTQFTEPLINTMGSEVEVDLDS